MRIVLGRGQRDAKVDVHDPTERSVTRKTGDSAADENVPVNQGFANERLLELSSEEKDQAVQAATAGRA